VASYRITPDQVEAWVARHFEYKTRRGGTELIMTNPFVPDDTQYKFNISLEPKYSKRDTEQKLKTFWVHDWRPHYQKWDSSFVKFVQRFKNCSFWEAIKDIGGTYSRLIHFPYKKAEKQEEIEPERIVELPTGSISFREDGDTLRKIALNYLKRRKLTEDTVLSHDLHYSAAFVVFPYYEYGMMVFWQARDLLNKRFTFPDTKTTGLEKADYIYGFDHVEPLQDVYVVEAIIDALTIGDGALAIGGDSISKKQRRKIKALRPGRVILCPDNDDAGRVLIKSMYKEMRIKYPSLYFVLPPDPHKDWNDYEVAEGHGAARKYIESNAQKITPPALFHL